MNKFWCVDQDSHAAHLFSFPLKGSFLLKGHIMLFCLFQPINDVQSGTAILNDAKVWHNEVRVCSTNPCGLYVMVLNVSSLSVFWNLIPPVCHSVIGFSISSSGWCVWTGQSEQSKLLEARQELKQSVSDRGQNPGKNRVLYEETDEIFEHQNI